MDGVTLSNGVEVAIDRAQGVRKLARLAGVTASAVSQWRSRGVVPAPSRRGDQNRAAIISAQLDIPLHVLNPIVYPAPMEPFRS